MAVILCIVTKQNDGSLRLTATDELPALEYGDQLQIELPVSAGEAPWKEQAEEARAAMEAQENRKRARNGLPPLSAATPEAFDKSLSQQVNDLTSLVAQLLARDSAARSEIVDADEESAPTEKPTAPGADGKPVRKAKR